MKEEAVDDALAEVARASQRFAVTPGAVAGIDVRVEGQGSDRARGVGSEDSGIGRLVAGEDFEHREHVACLIGGHEEAFAEIGAGPKDMEAGRDGAVGGDEVASGEFLVPVFAAGAEVVPADADVGLAAALPDLAGGKGAGGGFRQAEDARGAGQLIGHRGQFEQVAGLAQDLGPFDGCGGRFIPVADDGDPGRLGEGGGRGSGEERGQGEEGEQGSRHNARELRVSGRAGGLEAVSRSGVTVGDPVWKVEVLGRGF